MSRALFMDAVVGKHDRGKVVFGTPTSIVCHELLEQVGTTFPEAHLDAEKMADLAMAGHTVLGFDCVQPLFSVCHDSVAMGCDVIWGDNNRMPECRNPTLQNADDIQIPDDILMRPACQVPLQAISLLRKRLGDDAAVVGKVCGGWTQGYHHFGVENFLVDTILDPPKIREILERLAPFVIDFANAQLDAGADCIMLGDHATRDLCGPAAYEEFLQPIHKRLVEEIKAPVILHICGDTSDRINFIDKTGMACFHWDTKLGSPAKARELAGDRLALCGGISNLELYQESADFMKGRAIEAVNAGIDIIGPECCISLLTPMANLKAVTSIGRDAAKL